VAFEEYDPQTGLAIRDQKSKYFQKEYELQPYEKDTIESVEEHLDNGFYDDKNVVLEHFEILNSLLKKFEGIYFSEQKAGLANWSLRAKIDELQNLCSRLRALSETVPRVKVYRSM
jgi:hypothetical protein